MRLGNPAHYDAAQSATILAMKAPRRPNRRRSKGSSRRSRQPTARQAHPRTAQPPQPHPSQPRTANRLHGLHIARRQTSYTDRNANDNREIPKPGIMYGCVDSLHRLSTALQETLGYLSDTSCGPQFLKSRHSTHTQNGVAATAPKIPSQEEWPG